VFENTVLGRIFELHNKELHNLDSWPSIIGMIKSRKMGWERHVARMRRGKYNFGGKTIKRPLGRPKRSRRIILKCILNKMGCYRLD
jgi:hypothetical protein